MVSSQNMQLLDGCYHVYLDVGSNVGIQIRKLYEPSKYEGAKIHPVFDKYFHRRIQSLNSSLPYICAVGFEPNPNHENKLKALNDAYNKCQWKVEIFSKTAVSDQKGATTFFSDHDAKNLEWGGTIIDPSLKKYGQVKTSKSEEKSDAKKQNDILLIRLADFINNVVGRRKLPGNVDEKILGKPSVIMKLDIEGSEVEVVEDLIMQGSLQYIDVMMVEFHTWMAKAEDRKKASTILQDVITKISLLSEYMAFHEGTEKIHHLKVLPLDDEDYYLSNFSLPIC